jgi:hypothetical protein
MISKTPAALAVALAALGVGAPTASATPAPPPVSLNADAVKNTLDFSFSLTSEQIAGVLLFDNNADGEADSALIVQPGGGSRPFDAALTLDPLSSQDCQQFGSDNVVGEPAVDTTIDGDSATVTVPVPASLLPASFDAKLVPIPALGDDSLFCDVAVTDDGQGLATTFAGKQSFANPLAVAPGTPQGLSGSAGDGKVSLSWRPVAAAAEYRVYMDGHRVLTTAGTSATLTGLTNGVAHVFQISAANGAGESLKSAALSLTPIAAVVNPPGGGGGNPGGGTTPPPGPKPPSGDPDHDGIKNTWLHNGKPVAAPKPAKLAGIGPHTVKLRLPKAPKGVKLAVYLRTGHGAFKKVAVSAKGGSVTIKHLHAHTRYQVKVVKVNKAGKQSAASKAITVKTKKAAHG